MSRGRNGILCEGKNFEKRGLRGDKERYVFFSKTPHKTKKSLLFYLAVSLKVSKLWTFKLLPLFFSGLDL